MILTREQIDRIKDVADDDGYTSNTCVDILSLIDTIDAPSVLLEAPAGGEGRKTESRWFCEARLVGKP